MNCKSALSLILLITGLSYHSKGAGLFTSDTNNVHRAPFKKVLPYLIQTLDSVYAVDQQHRNALRTVQQNKGMGSVEEAAAIQAMNKADSTNQQIVTAIIDKYGWLGPREVGQKGNEALFYVIQHAGIDLQLKYLNQLKEAVMRNKASGKDCAFLIDRVEMRTGQAQTYGTQASDLDNVRYVYPVKDAAHLNQRRTVAGLPNAEQFYAGEHAICNFTPLSKTEEKQRDALLYELSQMFTDDQHSIEQYIAVIKKYGKGADEEVRQKALMQQTRNDLLVKAESILDKWGWPGYHLIGVPGCTTLFLILSRADAKTIEKYEPLLKATADKGEASKGYLAYFQDRIEVAHGRPQLYGTQIDQKSRKPYPIKDEGLVNDRRKALGLAPLKDYLKQTYNIDYSPSGATD